MNLRISGLLAIAAFALAGLLCSAQSLAQNAYITNFGSNNVSVIDTATNKVTTTIPVGSFPWGWRWPPMAAGPMLRTMALRTVSVIDTATNTVTATIPVGNFPIGVAVSPDGSRVYAANLFDQSISVIDTGTNTVIATAPVSILLTM
jgi:YVTN family beta-propeller protein